MARAIIARQDGDRFQARLFWLKAARLLDPAASVVQVGFEHGPKAFDDVWIAYAPERGPKTMAGEFITREHQQAKWHSSHGAFGHADFVDPAFVNANAVSLLQRARDAYDNYDADRSGILFRLVTNWTIDTADPLVQLVATRRGQIRVDKLAEQTDAGKFGRVRKLWREHLGIDDDALQQLAAVLGISIARGSLADLRDDLDLTFASVGMKRIPASHSAFPYDDLAFELMAEGRVEHDRDSFHALCRKEGLLAGSPDKAYHIGVKSFVHAFDRIEDRCTKVLDLTGEFDGRFIGEEQAWAGNLHPRLKAFLTSAAASSTCIRLALDAHLTLAFAAGSILNIKCGRSVEVEQRAPHLVVWSAATGPFDADRPDIETEIIDLDTGGKDVAVVIALTHDILEDVQSYVRNEQREIGRILHCRIAGSPSHQSVRSGQHADRIAAAVAAAIQKLGPPAVTKHLFAAAPNGLLFFLGQRQLTFGAVILYEHDFEGSKVRSYQPSLQLGARA